VLLQATAQGRLGLLLLCVLMWLLVLLLPGLLRWLLLCGAAQKLDAFVAEGCMEACQL
jgi:hypothetical protein